MDVGIGKLNHFELIYLSTSLTLTYHIIGVFLSCDRTLILFIIIHIIMHISFSFIKFKMVYFRKPYSPPNNPTPHPPPPRGLRLFFHMRIMELIVLVVVLRLYAYLHWWSTWLVELLFIYFFYSQTGWRGWWWEIWDLVVICGSDGILCLSLYHPGTTFSTTVSWTVSEKYYDSLWYKVVVFYCHYKCCML